MGEMKRAIAREQAAWSQSMQDEKRMKSTLVIAAAIIAAVRLARDPDITRPSHRLTAVVNESVIHSGAGGTCSALCSITPSRTPLLNTAKVCLSRFTAYVSPKVSNSGQISKYRFIPPTQRRLTQRPSSARECELSSEDLPENEQLCDGELIHFVF
jgi:hypothetical protein